MISQCTIRDLLWLTVVVAMGVAWWADHYDPENDRQWLELRAAAMQSALEGEGFRVEQEASRVRVYRPANPAKDDYESELRLPVTSAPGQNLRSD